MIIKSLELENIRSYKKQKIEFQEGINFLSGDIGSGKSSILQAIEFALFGFKRGDLEGYHLLRKGESEASVKLTLKNKENEIEIYRKIKKSKSNSNITQDNGYIKINENIEELSPSELNASIFELLNFPKEFLSKDKNLIYRFTIYTPQEQLKEILFAESDKRLEVIRKLFSIDKYKQLKEAVQIYLKELKEKKTTFQTKIEPKISIQENLKNISAQKEELEKTQKEYQKKLEPIEENLKKYEEALNQREEVLEKIRKNNIILEKNLSKIEELEKTKTDLETQIKTKEKTLEENSKDKLEEQIVTQKASQDKLEKSLKELSKQKEKQKKDLEVFESITKDKEIIQNQLSKIESKTEEIKYFSNSFDYILTKCQVKDLETKIAKISQKLRKSIKLEKESEDLKLELTKIELTNENILKEKQEKNKTLTNISKLESCPSCLQQIPHTHKSKLEKEMQTQIKDLEKTYNSHLSKTEVLKLKLKDHQNQIETFKKEETTLIESNEKLKLFKEKEEKEKQDYNKLKLLKKDLEELNKLKLEETLKELKNKETQKETCQKDLEKTSLQEEELKEQISKTQIKTIEFESKKKELSSLASQIKELKDKTKEIESQLKKKEDILSKIKELKLKETQIKEKKQKIEELLKKLRTNEKLILEKITSCKTRLEENEKYKKEKQNELEKIQILEKELKKLLSTENLLADKTLKISDLIEKTLFTKYYVEFNETFENLFKELIEAGEIEIRLNEEFSPIVEQNGYDIDIKNLSGGEKSSLAIAYRLGLKEIIENNLKRTQKLSLLILDEPTDGFSNQQIDRLGNILKERDLHQIILVSHDEKIESIADSVLHVEKVNHISEVN